MDQADKMAHANIRSIKELVDAGLEEVPAPYIRPPQERVQSRERRGREDVEDGVPLINLTNHRLQVLQEIALACSDWGIFQVVNHGICSALQSQLWSAAHQFFALPMETKLELVSQDPSNPLVFFTGFSIHEKVKEWKDTLGFKPNHSMNHKLLPEFLRDPMLKFHNTMEILAHTLCELLFCGLVEDSNVLHKHLSRATMAFNYYPCCPEPQLTFGLSSHSDFGFLTIVMQDDVQGLQVKRKDDWVDVKPISNAFTIILGDQLEILTNGHYKSVEHRVVTNQTKPRMSIGCFYGPSEHENVKPLDKFVTENCPTMYKEVKFSDYLIHGFTNGLNGKANLELISLKPIPSK